MAVTPQRLRLMLITDRSVCPGALVERVDAALRGGATAIMLREKGLSTRDLYELGAELREVTKRHGALLIVNDRIDIALAVGADGVHLGWQSLPLEKARELLRPGQILGVSTHSPEEARAKQEAGADYVTFSPIYPTPSKEGLVDVQGLEELRRAREQVQIPLVALGGINAANAGEVFRCGADGVAMIRALLTAEDPERAAREILNGARVFF